MQWFYLSHSLEESPAQPKSGIEERHEFDLIVMGRARACQEGAAAIALGPSLAPLAFYSRSITKFLLREAETGGWMDWKRRAWNAATFNLGHKITLLCVCVVTHEWRFDFW